MLYIRKRGGEITVTYGSITYPYENLPAEIRFAIARELKKFCPGYFPEYNRLKSRYGEAIVERKMIEKLLKKMRLWS